MDKRKIIEQIENLPMRKINVAERLTQSQAKELARTFPKHLVNKNDGRVVIFPVATIGKIYSSKNNNTIKIIKDIPYLYETSIYAWSEPETWFEGHKEHSNIKEYHYYLNKFNDGDNDFYIRITIPEEYQGKTGEARKVIHTATVSEISVYKKGDLSRQSPVIRRGASDKSPLIDRKLQEFLYTVEYNK